MAQQIDWQTFDPKKATPEEMQRMHDFLENNIRDTSPRSTGDPREIRSLIIRGNKITTVVYNYGNITRPNTLYNVADLVWNRLGYGFEFTPLVGGEVIDVERNKVSILDDGMWLASQGGYSPDGSLKWGWLPKAGYAAPGQPDIAAWSHRAEVRGDLTRKPHSWPESWYNQALGRYVWPAYLGNDATSPDEEVYFVVDDYTNAKYTVLPFPDDSTKRGLGLDLECRFFQFNNPLAEDIIFLVYRVTNKSPKTIDKVYFGMYGDPHVGGAKRLYRRPRIFHPPQGIRTSPSRVSPARTQHGLCMGRRHEGRRRTRPRAISDSSSSSLPRIPTNGKDDDDDGIIDESPFNDAGSYIDGISIPADTRGSPTRPSTSKCTAAQSRAGQATRTATGISRRTTSALTVFPGTGDFGEGNGKPDVGYDAERQFHRGTEFRYSRRQRVGPDRPHQFLGAAVHRARRTSRRTTSLLAAAFPPTASPSTRNC